MSPFRTSTKLLRFAPDELAAITGRAHRCGQTPARFIREAALGIIPHARRGARDDDLLRQLARIGNNLNQLAREANSENRFPLESRIDAVLHEILDVAHRLR